MRKFVRPLAFSAALGTAGLAGSHLFGDAPARPAAAADPAAKPADLKFAVDPRPLGEPAKKGLKWLAAQQNTDGGFPQGGGWRTGGDKGGGRVENAADPSDVGNTCIALLALYRAGNTPTAGEYKDVMKKGVKYVCDKIDKADAKDLYVTDVRDTQMQSKIGPYVDTFMATLVLSELKGKAGDDDKRVLAALDKTIDKIAKNQKDDGTFAGNGGWAPVLSQGVANKALSRARQNGAEVNKEVFARATNQSVDALNGRGGATATGAAEVATAAAPAVTGPVPAVPPAVAVKPGDPKAVEAVAALPAGRAVLAGAGFGGGGGVGDAGVKLYSLSQAAGNTQDVFNGLKIDADKAKKVIDDAKATPAEKADAEKTIKRVEEVRREADKAQEQLGAQIKDRAFVNGFGSNGGEEFLSFLNIAEALVVKGGPDWKAWDDQMQDTITKAQDKDGSWSGHHCITGKTFCTAGALLVMMADRTQFPADVIKAAREPKAVEVKKDEVKQEEKK